MTTKAISGGRLEMTESVDATIVKIEEDKQLVFGWANIIKTAEGKMLLDRQDDFIDDDNELEKAAYHYVLHSRDGGEMHLRKGVSTLVESVVLTDEKQKALGIPANTVPTGWWIGFKVNDDSVWKQIKKGGYVGFSVHGTGRREKTSLDLHKYTDIEKGATKRDGGYDYPASAYAYVPDPAQPSTWKLRLWQTPEQKVTAKQVGMAIAALGPGGFRGNRVQLPSDAVAGVKRKVLSAWRSVHGKGEEVPTVLRKEEITKYIKQKPNGKWCVYSESGKLLSEHNTKAEAQKRLAQIEHFKKEQPTSSDVHVDSTEWDKRRRKRRILTNAALEKFNPNHDEAGRFSSGPGGGGGGAKGRQPGGPKGRRHKGVELYGTLKQGTKVVVRHKGKDVQGTIVRLGRGGSSGVGADSYVVDVGEQRSIWKRPDEMRRGGLGTSKPKGAGFLEAKPGGKPMREYETPHPDAKSGQVLVDFDRGKKPGGYSPGNSPKEQEAAAVWRRKKIAEAKARPKAQRKAKRKKSNYIEDTPKEFTGSDYPTRHLYS